MSIPVMTKPAHVTFFGSYWIYTLPVIPRKTQQRKRKGDNIRKKAITVMLKKYSPTIKTLSKTTHLPTTVHLSPE